jgi:asparagine synthase (glutamine-hydrolysing)
VANGIKQGFSGPDASWFKGESIDYVRATLFNGHAKIYDAMDKSETRRMVEDHLKGRVNRRLLIWSLLSVEEWFNQYTDD